MDISKLSKSRQQDIRNIGRNGRDPIIFLARRNGRAGWKLDFFHIDQYISFDLDLILKYLEDGWHIIAGR